jgi:hypothetical protein
VGPIDSGDPTHFKESDPIIQSHRRNLQGIFLALALAVPALVEAQVDQARAEQYFKEAAALCAREGGRTWGVSLCGPMVIADAATQTIAANQPMPADKRPAALGFANAALDWGGTRWSTFVWPRMPSDERRRAVLMMHELFHRVQPGLGLLLPEPDNSHLDTLEGRYWLQLEWRALAKALGTSGPERSDALRDALAFRRARRNAFPTAAQNERVLEVNEGLAQYTGTVAAVTTAAEAAAAAVEQLTSAPLAETFVRTFAYPSGAAYGILLDTWSPGWTRKFRPTDDIGDLVAAAAAVTAAADPDAAATRYGGPGLRAADQKRHEDRLALVKDLKRRFVDGPVLVIPRARNAAFITSGMVPIPGAGMIYPGYRATTEWGALVAERVLMSTDRSTIAVPAPVKTAGPELVGEGWTLKLSPGWVVRPGPRPGDFVVIREQ